MVATTADELEHPHTPRSFRAANAALRPVATQVASLHPESIVQRSLARTRLTDFGGDSWRAPLDVLTRALETEARLHPIGRVSARQQLIGLLTTRLRVHDLLTRHPEILETPVVAPVVILGMPRTGTTALQRLLAREPAFRSLPLWEAMTPLPPGDAADRAAGAVAGARVKRCEQSLRLIHWAGPQMLAMHEMHATEADEEIWLLAVDFATMLFEASYHVPSFRDWYLRTDLTGGYEYLRTLLQILQWYRPAERWLLKSPQHLEQLGPLLRAFPDATIVQTHRDPVTVTASFCSMGAYGRRMNTDHISVRAIGEYWSARIEGMLRRSIDDRVADDPRYLDVRFDDFVADPIGLARAVCEHAGVGVSPTGERQMLAYLDANPRGKHGRHAYRLEEFGLDETERRDALRFYSDRFGV
ncbi:MAG TPA: sulfotransferase [Acidimicrobiia bacterium]|nr:sulfotransferase [Acidimicrobiia bacterium]